MTGVARLGVGIELVGRQHRGVGADRGASIAPRPVEPTGLLMSGDAGVGKSRLVAEAVERATAAGFTVLVGRCLDTGESALPYLPFTEIVGALSATHPELVAEHEALRHLLPGGFPHGPAATGEQRDLGQLQVFDAVLSALDDLTAAAPALLVVEDLHWADRSSRDLLFFLLSRLTGQRLVVLATYRSDDLHRRHPLRALLSELVRLPAVERSTWRRSTPRVAGARAPARRRAALPSRWCARHRPPQRGQRVLRRGAGLRLLRRAAARPGRGAGGPRRRAPATAQRVLRIASVAGRRVQPPTGWPRCPGCPTTTWSRRCARRPPTTSWSPRAPSRAGADDGYHFRHALLREAIYHELLPGERSRLHAAYAQLLASPAARATGVAGRPGRRAGPPRDGRPRPAPRARRVRAGRRGGRRPRGARRGAAARRAGHRAVARGARRRGGGRRRRGHGHPLGRVGGEQPPATRTAASRSAGGRSSSPSSAATRALSARIGQRYALRLMDLAGREQEALAAARRALSLIAHDPPSSDLAWAHAVLARVLYRLDHFAEAVSEAEAALAVARQVPADDCDRDGATADALVTLAVCDGVRRRPGARPAAARRGQAAGPAVQQPGGRAARLLLGRHLPARRGPARRGRRTSSPRARSAPPPPAPRGARTG